MLRGRGSCLYDSQAKFYQAIDCGTDSPGKGVGGENPFTTENLDAAL
jgi:hypothetical protein